MKKIVFLPFLLFISISIIAQNEPRKIGGVSSKATAPKPSQLVENSTPETPKSTICFNEVDVAENIVKTRTSFYCSIFSFNSVSEAEAFANAFKSSDSNVMEFSFVGVKNSYYYFNFSIKIQKISSGI